MSRLFVAFVFLLSVQTSSAENLRIGDDMDTVLSLLGKPSGSVKILDRTKLLYPKGEVVLQEDAVIEFDLMSDEEFLAEEARKQKDREEWLAMEAKRKEAHKEEGIAVRAHKRGSSAFASLPAKDRVDFWRSFQVRYPGIDVSDDLARALDSYQSELAELKAQEEIAQLNARVARAEKAAANARIETQKLKEESERKQRSRNYGLRYYYDPVVQPRCVYRPSTVTIISNGQKTQVKQHRPVLWKY